MGEESWALIRKELIQELQTRYSLYVELFGTKETLVELIIYLYVESGPIATSEKWMSIPNMSYVIITRYNAIMVHLSWIKSWTFFPLRSRTPSIAQQRVITIGFFYKCHFVHAHIIYLKDCLLL